MGLNISACNAGTLKNEYFEIEFLVAQFSFKSIDEFCDKKSDFISVIY